MSRNRINGVGRGAAEAAPRRAVRLEPNSGAVITLRSHPFVAPRVPLAGPAEWLLIVGAALCEIAALRRDLESMNVAGDAPIACALDSLRRDALRLLSSLAHEVRGH